jgi:hypothetical protein
VDVARPLQAMRLRRAVLQIPAKSSVSHRLPLHNSRPRLTHSESTLPQLLIPLHFNSFRSNTYKKPGGGYPSQDHKVSHSLLRTPRRTAHTRTPATLMLSMAYFTVLCAPGGGPAVGHSCLSPDLPTDCGSLMGHGSSGPRVPLHPNPQSARITLVTAWRHLGKHLCSSGV